jgi:hypothetical protein
VITVEGIDRYGTFRSGHQQRASMSMLQLIAMEFHRKVLSVKAC